ncbi:GrpE nucleotide exchange factor [Dillenia turbinata]|uniref:GrpE nucleotide exchange factor n=1 Tax=Dillenia turbinata TaxID=194707 RepID=A0AAN8ZJI2_9MAGN
MRLRGLLLLDKESPKTGNDDSKAETTNMSEDAKASDQAEKSSSNSESQKQGRTFEDEPRRDRVLRSYVEMENVMDRTRREAENSKKFAIQNFAKSLLDVADNLGRASSVVKESFSKIDASNDTAGAVPLLKTLLEGVEMTEKQLAEVFKKYGVEKYDPLNEQFNPHRHNAVFQIPDGSKAPGTVAAVLKAGYMLYDRVIGPAEVGVIQEVDNSQAEQVLELYKILELVCQVGSEAAAARGVELRS